MKRVLLILALGLGGLSGAAEAPRPNTVLTPNFQNTDIAVVAQSVQEATGITFILDQAAASRKISFPNRRPMSAGEFYDTFISILAVNGLAAVPSGRNTMKIVQEANARTLPGRSLSGTPGPDELVHAVIPVKNVNAQQIATVLNQLRSQYGVVQAVPGTNQIIINDRASNVTRMREIVERVDLTSSGELDVIRLQYATAADVVRNLTSLIGTQQAANAAAGIAPRLTSDPRTNSVLIVGEPAARVQLATWVAHLDTPLEDGGGEPEVIYLRYGDAETLAPLLKEFATGVAQAQAVAAAGGTNPAAAAAASPSSSASSAIDRSTTILAELGTNALIVTAPPKMMRELKAIIDRLDIPRPQVYIEGIIAEVSTDKAADLGVNWAVYDDSSDARIPAGGFISPIGGASIVDLAGLALDPDSIPEAAASGAIPRGATFGVGRLREGGLSFAAVIRALRTDGESNVIANPQLLALDNDEAVFQDGQQVPFLSSFTTTSANSSTSNPISSVNREDIGTKLTITPQINDGGAMTLDIQLESSELTGTTGDANSAITNKRSFDTKVRVDDGQTIVLAGMIRNFEVRSETRVPFLGRIPVIGELFKTRSAQRQQKMLMVFLRPAILTDSEVASARTREKYEQIREQQRKQGSRRELLPILPFNPSPQLPEMPPDAVIRPAPQGAGPGATTTPVP